jgi:DNA-binding XRE family transcriptional regulator
MSVLTNKHHIEQKQAKVILRFIVNDGVYDIPKEVAEQYREDSTIPAEEVFSALDKKYTKAGVLLKGLRYREGLNQIEFAKKIKVSQSDLSKMENGRRPIGKIIAKRIQKVFGTDYRYFLE